MASENTHPARTKDDAFAIQMFKLTKRKLYKLETNESY